MCPFVFNRLPFTKLEGKKKIKLVINEWDWAIAINVCTMAWKIDFRCVFLPLYHIYQPWMIISVKVRRLSDCCPTCSRYGRRWHFYNIRRRKLRCIHQGPFGWRVKRISYKRCAYMAIIAVWTRVMTKRERRHHCWATWTRWARLYLFDQAFEPLPTPSRDGR